jgi:hypothetical protein
MHQRIADLSVAIPIVEHTMHDEDVAHDLLPNLPPILGRVRSFVL